MDVEIRREGMQNIAFLHIRLPPADKSAPDRQMRRRAGRHGRERTGAGTAEVRNTFRSPQDVPFGPAKPD